MTTRHPAVSTLPAIAFVTLVTTGEVIALCHGKQDYYRVQTQLKSEDLNRLYGVSPTQARAMLRHFIRDWTSPVER
jgi:hypothetical protein